MTSPNRWYLFIIPLLLVTISCTSSNREEGFVYFALNNNPTTLDPAYVVDVTGGSLTAKLFNGLVRIDQDLNIIPDIAHRWDISPDGRVYTFFLRKDVRFSNGRVVTAQDFVYSFERILDPANRCPNTWVLDKIEGADEFKGGAARSLAGLRVIDDYTLRVVLQRPFSPFLSLLTMTSAYVVPKEEIERRGDSFGFNPVGTGPYKLKSWTANVDLVFEARSTYFEGKPHVQGLVYRIIPEDLTTISEFEIGNLDIIALPPSVYNYYQKSNSWRDRIISQKGLNTYYLGFNCEKIPFRNRLVRQAAGYAIDREKILRTFFEGRGRLAQGPVADNLRAWEFDYPYTYNPEKARELLEHAGVEFPVKVDFYVTARPQTVVDVAEIIQSYLNAAGFSVRIQQLEWSAYKEALNNGMADLFWLSWWADYPDPENFLFPLFHSSNMGPAGNRTRFRNQEVDRLIEQGQSSVERERRDRYYRKAEQLIMNEAPWIPFWHRNDYLLQQPWIWNAPVAPIYSIDKGMAIAMSEPAGTND